mmetsp:Transcript_12077/g.36830  ORF Transcript_12077/g.36830 Transcript_12077/m.36830 type:complete len:137 (+) Transcript_12077:159-569(+)
MYSGEEVCGVNMINALSCSYEWEGCHIVLPFEIENMILEMLEGDLIAIAKVRQLCKRWKWLVDNNRRIWKTMPLRLPTRFPSEAEKWYRKAAKMGNANAAFLLSLLYTYGYRCSCHHEADLSQSNVRVLHRGVLTQ